MIKVVWSDFKAFINSRNPDYHELEFSSHYAIQACDGALQVTCKIKKAQGEDVKSDEQVEYETNYQATARERVGNEAIRAPFAAKILPNGRKLFRRKHGAVMSFNAAQATATLDIDVPYNVAKINLVEILYALKGDTVDLTVHDSPAGVIQLAAGVEVGDVEASKMLNQFGFSVNLQTGKHIDQSNYDADLVKDMRVKVVVTRKNAVGADEYGVNWVFHEVV